MAYVELHCHSAYSFLDGASHPEELALRAAELGYEALALTDHEGVYGSLELAHAAKLVGVRPITGAEVTLHGGVARDLARRVLPGVREPLPPADRGARAHAAEGRDPAAARARPCSPGRAEREGSSASRAARDRASVSVTRTPPPPLAARFGRERFYVELQRPFERGDAPPERAPPRPRRLMRASKTVVTGNVHAHYSAPHRAPGRARSRSATAPRSSRASVERRGNRESILRAPAEMLELFPTTAMPSCARPRSPRGSSST